MSKKNLRPNARHAAKVSELLSAYPIGANDLQVFTFSLSFHSASDPNAAIGALELVARNCPQAKPFIHAIQGELGNPLTAETEEALRRNIDGFPFEDVMRKKHIDLIPYHTEESALHLLRTFRTLDEADAAGRRILQEIISEAHAAPAMPG